MKRGRPGFWSKISRGARERIEAAIDAGQESPRAIFDRFNLQQYSLSPLTFQRLYQIRRRQWADRPAPPPAVDTSPASLTEAMLDSLQTALDSGRYPEKKLPEAIKAMVALAQLDLAKQAQKRAEEVHAAKMAEFHKKLTAAVEQKTAGDKTLTRADVYDLVDQVMRGAA